MYGRKATDIFVTTHTVQVVITGLSVHRENRENVNNSRQGKYREIKNLGKNRDVENLLRSNQNQGKEKRNCTMMLMVLFLELQIHVLSL